MEDAVLTLIGKTALGLIPQPVVAASEPPLVVAFALAGTVDIEIRGTDDERSIAIRQSTPPLGRELNDRERLAVLDALALATDDLDGRCPLRIVGSSSTRLMICVR